MTNRLAQAKSLYLRKHAENPIDWWSWCDEALATAKAQNKPIFLSIGYSSCHWCTVIIVRLSIIAAIFLALFFWIELTRRQPFINLRLLRYRNFGLASVVNVSLGVGLYGSIYILPLYLAQIQGYNALQIGEVLIWAGIPQLFIIPFIPKIMQRIDIRLMVAVGVALFSISVFMNAGMTYQTGLDQLRWSQLVRAMGQPLIMVPLTSIATAGLSPKEAGSASGLFNMMRNLGGSIGIAALATLLTNREQFHSNRLGESISIYSPATQERINQLTQYFANRGGVDLNTAQNQAIAAIDKIVRRESFVMAFNDCFYFIGIALLLSGLAILFIKKVKPTGGAVAH
ncbi:hypothetical protein NUACC21_01820 [Scytonema sp. NUACC21]